MKTIIIAAVLIVLGVALIKKLFKLAFWVALVCATIIVGKYIWLAII